MKVQTSQEFPRKCAKCGPRKNPNTWEISTKVQTPQGFEGFIKNILSVDLWKIPHLENIDERSKLLKSCIENVLSMNLWKIPHSENTNESPNSSRVSSKYTKCEPLKKSTFRKHWWKSELLKSFIENVLSVDLWKIPHLENMDGRSNFSRAPSKCTEYRPLKNSTLRKYRWKTEILKGFIENVPSVYLWEIPHLENIDERPNSSRVSSKMY